MNKIILSAFSDEYNADIDIQLQVLSENGVKYFEPRFIGEKNIASLTREEAIELKAKMDKYGVAVSSVGSPLGKINLADDFEEHLEKAKNVFEIANILGTKYVRVFSFYLRPGQTREEARDEVIEKLTRLIDLADEYGLVLCHENESRIYGENDDTCLDLLSHFGGRLGCVFDMGNFVLFGTKPYPEAYEKLKPYITYFHIKDALAAGAIVPPGKGEGFIKEILASYSEYADHEFFVSLEPHLETFSGLHALTSFHFENPYKFETAEGAFLTALNDLKGIIAEI